MPSTAIGAMREQLVLQRNDPPTVTVTSLTRTSTTATATTSTAHGFVSNDYVTVSGATPAGYNGKVKVTVTGPTTFTYPVNGLLATPATGAITVVYASNASGGVIGHWRDAATVWAEMMPLGAMERLQIQQVQSNVTYRFRVRRMADLVPEMRAIWTPSWPPSSAAKTLAITGVPLEGDGRTYQFIECSEVPA